ncbi:MAG: Calx-beta domain-containing protein [Pyrinomonadaceae bacterium]
MTMVHFGPGSTTVSPTWFAALAYCDGVERNTDRRLQCAESMSNGRGWTVNPQPGATPLGSIRFDTRFELPYGLAPPTIAPQLLAGGGMPAGLITDCSYCSSLVGQDGGTLVGQDGSTLVGQDGSTLVGQDGSTLVGQDGSTLVGQDGSTLVGQDGGTLVGNDGASRANIFGPNLMRRNSLTGTGPTRPALPRSPGDLVTGNTGYMVIKGSGGSAPTVTYETDDVTGRSYMNVSITLDNTSTPRVSNLANMAFTVGLNPGVLKLQSRAITVNENAGFATVTVQRSGDTASPASFDYSTVQNADVTSCAPGSPSGNGGEKCDFAATIGAVRFEANETSKEIRIPIVDDTYAEGNESFKLLIGNALGAAIELPSAATITITDNDSVSGPANPLDNADAQFFVRQQYLDLLGREPSSAEMTADTGPIATCGSDATCRRTKAVDLSYALFQQAQPAAGYVFRLYRAAFGNDQPFPLPDTSNPIEAKKWVNYTAFSRDLALMTEAGQSLTQKRVELANSFVLRPAFTRRYSPITLNNGPAFVDAILATIRNEIGVDLASQRSILISAFEQSDTLMEGRAAVMYRLADASLANPVNNTPFVTAEDSRSFASALYNGYLKRDGDVSALSSVLTQLQGGTQKRTFVDQFAFGLEYRQRFGPASAPPLTVSGRVLTPSGIALRNATVSMTNQQGVRRTATTSSFGVFSFANVAAGETMTFSIASKRYRFSPRIIQLDSSNSALADFIGLE